MEPENQQPSQEPSKKTSKKEAAKAEKLRRRQEAAAVAAASSVAAVSIDGPDPLASNYGDIPIKDLQSKTISGRVWTTVSSLTDSLKDETVLIRGRAHAIRAVGKKMAFLTVREKGYTVQCVLTVSPDVVSAHMVKYATNISKESFIDVEGTVTVPPEPIKGASQQVEVQVRKIYCVNRAANVLPINVEDAARSEVEIDKALEAGEQLVRVNQDTRLNYRILDLRTPANQGIYRLECQVSNLFRQFLLNEDFVEIHTPKLTAGTSEGGAAVFKLEYKGKPACLAQSPQLHKQMAICGDFGRVFVVGPVFRAEDSYTHRHLCEFTGLDVEMEIKEHYSEVMDIVDRLFVEMFDKLNERCSKELEAIGKQYPFTPLKYLRNTLRLTFEEGFVVFGLDKLCSRMPLGQERFVVIEDLQGWGYSCTDIRGYLAALSILQTNGTKRLARMVQTDTLANSGQSEPPDIKNWFSSYEYESLVLETNDNFGFSDNLETQIYEKECSTRNTMKALENSCELVSSEKDNGMMHEECNQFEDVNTSQSYVSDSENSSLLSPVEESEPPRIDNWFSSYVYESPEVNTIDDLILSAPKESIIESNGKVEKKRKEVEKDISLCQTDDLICNKNAESDNGATKDDKNSTELPCSSANVNSFEKAEIPSCGTHWSEENGGNKHEDAGNGFVSIKRKSIRENNENSMSVKRIDQKLYASSSVIKLKGDEKAKKRTTLGDVTNIEHSSVTGKWKCPRRENPDVGPPLKQLRLGKWFHYV